MEHAELTRIIIGCAISVHRALGVLIENKAVQALNKAHEVQLVNYLVATQIETGLLLNFGAQRLQFRRKSRVYRPKEEENEDWTG